MCGRVKIKNIFRLLGIILWPLGIIYVFMLYFCYIDVQSVKLIQEIIEEKKAHGINWITEQRDFEIYRPDFKMIFISYYKNSNKTQEEIVKDWDKLYKRGERE